MSGCVNYTSFICEWFLIFNLKTVKLQPRQEQVLDKERGHSKRYKYKPTTEKFDNVCISITNSPVKSFVITCGTITGINIYSCLQKFAHSGNTTKHQVHKNDDCHTTTEAWPWNRDIGQMKWRQTTRRWVETATAIGKNTKWKVLELRLGTSCVNPNPPPPPPPPRCRRIWYE